VSITIGKAGFLRSEFKHDDAMIGVSRSKAMSHFSDCCWRSTCCRAVNMSVGYNSSCDGQNNRAQSDAHERSHEHRPSVPQFQEIHAHSQAQVLLTLAGSSGPLRQQSPRHHEIGPMQPNLYPMLCNRRAMLVHAVGLTALDVLGIVKTLLIISGSRNVSLLLWKQLLGQQV
jgi:hypothetical protein